MVRFLIVLFFSMLVIKTSFAQELACKGLLQSECVAQENCKWINSFERKDGRVIKAYCRKLPRKLLKNDVLRKKKTNKKQSNLQIKVTPKQQPLSLAKSNTSTPEKDQTAKEAQSFGEKAVRWLEKNVVGN